MKTVEVREWAKASTNSSICPKLSSFHPLAVSSCKTRMPPAVSVFPSSMEDAGRIAIKELRSCAVVVYSYSTRRTVWSTSNAVGGHWKRQVIPVVAPQR